MLCTTYNSKSVSLEYKITQKSHSESVLYDIKDYFSAGSVVIDNRKTVTKKFHITNLKFILEKIIPHFERYPCLTSKALNFKDWKKVATLISTKKNLTSEGVVEIKNILSKMNTKRLFKDKYDYCNSNLNLDLNGSVNFNLSPFWVQGFLDGEATFYAHITPLSSSDTGLEHKIKEEILTAIPSVCNLSLEVAQNSHDVSILLALKQEGGYIKPKYNVNNFEECFNSRSVNRYIFRSPIEKLVKFLSDYPLKTRKKLDYNDWKNILELKKEGMHKNTWKKCEKLKIKWIIIEIKMSKLAKGALMLEPYAMKVARTVLREKIYCKIYLSLNRP